MKTKRQLQKMPAGEVVDYLIKNHRWHRLKHTTTYRRRYSKDIFEIAGFQLVWTVIGGADETEGYAASHEIINLKTGQESPVEKHKFLKLIEALEKTKETRETNRKNRINTITNLIPIVVPVAIFGGVVAMCYYYDKKAKQQTPKQTEEVYQKNDSLLSYNTYHFYNKKQLQH